MSVLSSVDLEDTICIEKNSKNKTLNLVPVGADRCRLVSIGVDGDGSTKSPSRKGTSRDNARLHWSMTWNNPILEDVKKFWAKLGVDGVDKNPKIRKGRMQPERGEKGTLHYQIQLSFKTRTRFSTIQTLCGGTCHIEPTRNVEAAFDYVCKTETAVNDPIWPVFEYGFPKKLITLSETELYDWQAEIEKLLQEKPDKRTVNWVVDPEGNNGKTEFCKYLAGKYRERIVFITAGDVKDVANCLKNAADNGTDLNDLIAVVFHYPRSAEHIAYKAIECCKDGFITNTKYESGTLVFNNPHVWVFSNDEPNTSKLTCDRWKVWTIENRELILIDLNEDSQDEPIKKTKKKSNNIVYFDE